MSATNLQGAVAEVASEADTRLLAVESGSAAIADRATVLEAGHQAAQLLDVREWASGFTGTDAAQNTAALRGIAAAVKAAGGGVVRIPFADFPVDCSASIPLENSPGATVVYEGLTVNALAATAAGTRIRRAAGTLDVLSWVGTGNGGSARCHGGLRHIELDGGGVNVRIARFSRCNELELPILRVVGGPTDNMDYGGIEFEQVWNTHGGILLLYHCGGASTPAMLVKGLSGDALPACDSLGWQVAKWEACKGVAYRAAAPGGGNVHATQFFGEVNLESQLSGQTATVFDILDADLTIDTLSLKLSPADGTSVFWRQDTSDGVAIPRTQVGKMRLQHGGAVSHFVDVQRGSFLFGPAHCLGTPSTAGGGTGKYFKIGANVSAGAVGPRRPVVTDASKVASDARTYGSIEPFGTRTIPCVMTPDTNATAVIVTSGSTKVPGIEMPGTSDSTIVFSAAAPSDAVGVTGDGSTYSVRVVCTIDGAAGVGGNNTLRMGGRVNQAQSGAAVTGSTAAFATQSVVVPAVLAEREMYFGVGQALPRGQRVYGRLNRDALSDALDDYTGRLVVLRIDLVAVSVAA